MPGDPPAATSRSLILVDESIEGDRRVAQSIAALPGGVIFDIRTPGAPGLWSRSAWVLTATWSIVVALCDAPLARKRRIALVLRDMVRHRPLAGLVGAWLWTYRAIRAAEALKRSSDRFDVIHAHDLYCGLCALSILADRGSRLVYNAHELEIHRNRPAGWLRILVEHAFEQRVLRRADEVVVVNRAIAEANQSLYDFPGPKLRIEYNDFYAYHPIPKPDPTQPPSIVYVGKGVHGRHLELLDRPDDELGFSVHVYFLGKQLPAGLSGRFWRFGPVAYEADLLSLVGSRRCLMWCCLRAHALSYRLALPNKFFQALAVGIPVIASPGTYVAELVDRYQLGVVFDGTDFAELARRVRSPEFERWVGAVTEFRDAFRKGAIVI